MLSTQDINAIISGVIQREGGYVNHSRDPGGETKYGISKRAYPREDIANLTFPRAVELYRRDYVEKFRLAELTDYRVAECVMDWVVNSGAGGIKSIQRRLGITADGIVGPETLKKLNEVKDYKEILRWRLHFYASIVDHPFIKGWISRVLELGL